MSYAKGKIFFITGAAGSIGSILCQHLQFGDAAGIVAFDNSELGLYNLKRTLGTKRIAYVLGDVTRYTDVATALSQHPSDVVVHAAAYKHVAMCQENPFVANRVNVGGTEIVLHAADMRDVKTVVLVSTDKAVRPICVMGETKRRAEQLATQAGKVVIRLGNVYGSSGSVVPLWKEKIAAGLPIELTHPDATRYFIQPLDAAEAIISAAQCGQPGEMLVPEMGRPKRLFDLAKELGAQHIFVTKLGEGEKLHEELFVHDEDYKKIIRRAYLTWPTTMKLYVDAPPPGGCGLGPVMLDALYTFSGGKC